MRKHVAIGIIGSGPAGYTAAIYAARAGFPPLLFAGPQVGGQLVQSPGVENYPGFVETIDGFELVENMRRQAERFGTQVLFESVLSLEKQGEGFVLKGESTEVEAQRVILATGSTAKRLNVPGEAEFFGYGVSACATCDGFFYKGRRVAVVGGGNTAVTDALHLASIAQHVTLIHRRDALRAEKTLQNRVFSLKNVDFLWNSEVESVEGEQNAQGTPAMTALRVKNRLTGEVTTVPLDGVFVAIGHEPQNQLVQHLVELDEHGYVKTLANSMQTSCPGLYAAGDVMDPLYQQAITAAAHGCQAAMEVAQSLG